MINNDVTDHCQKVKHGCGLELCTVAICAWKLSEIEFAFFLANVEEFIGQKQRITLTAQEKIVNAISVGLFG